MIIPNFSKMEPTPVQRAGRSKPWADEELLWIDGIPHCYSMDAGVIVIRLRGGYAVKAPDFLAANRGRMINWPRSLRKEASPRKPRGLLS